MILESPIARRSDPISSHLAAAEHTLSGERAKRCALVLRLLRAAGKPVTYRELWALHAEECKLDGARPIEAVEFERRLADQRQEGQAASGEKRPCAISKRTAQEWTAVSIRCCRECARPLPVKSSARRIYCNDFCRTRKYLAARPDGIAPRPGVGFEGPFLEGREARDKGFARIACPYGHTDPDRRAWWWMRGWKVRQLEQLAEARGETTNGGRMRSQPLPTTPGMYLFRWLHSNGRNMTVEVYERDGQLFAIDLEAKARAAATYEPIGPGMRLSRIPAGRIAWEPVSDRESA